MPMRPKTLARAGGAGLACLGLALVVLGLPARGPRLERTASAFLSTDRPGITAHNSPAAAIDPRRPTSMAVADKIDTPDLGCAVSVSRNGGDNWDPVDLAVVEPGTQCFWPDVAFDDDGALVVLYTAMRDRFNQSLGVWLQRFPVGEPAGEPVRVAGPNSFHARFAVDGDRVVVAWVQTSDATPFQRQGIAPGNNPLVLSTSTDGGRTFSEPLALSAEGQLVLQPTVVIGNDGKIVVGALDLGEDLLDYESRHEGQSGDPYEGTWRVVTWTSTDGGGSFTSAAAGEIQPPQRIYVDVTSPAPGFAVDRTSGRIYAAWDSGRGDDRDVYVAASDDAGLTWQPANRIPRDGSQSLPAVAVAPDGRLDVLFYDRSRDPADVLTDATLASSWDGGRSFTAGPVSDRNFDSRVGFGSLQGLPSLGQQLAVLSEEDRALAFWSDTRRGNVDTNAQDLAVAIVEVQESRARRWPLVALGAALVLGGATVAFWPQSSAARPKRR